MNLSVDPSARARWLYIGLAGLLSLVWLATLAGRPLFNPDEGRYAEIPREMLSGGDWVIPHLNGLDYIEKPPLQYWATAAAYRLLGVSEFSARLYTALTALASLAVDRISDGAALGRRRRLARRGGSVRHVHVRHFRSADDLGYEPDVLDDGKPRGFFAGAARTVGSAWLDGVCLG